jgi:hypothetical protein
MGSVSELATWESGEAAAPGPWAGSDDVAQEHEIRLDAINLLNPVDSLTVAPPRMNAIADLHEVGCERDAWAGRLRSAT